MVQDNDKWAHDGWHATLTPVPNPPGVETVESTDEMMRRLLREVVVLSQRMDAEGT
jgi:hypothetical protein